MLCSLCLLLFYPKQWINNGMVDGIDTTSVTAEIAEKAWYQKVWHWILSWFIEEYEVTVYFVSEKITHPENWERAV